MSKHKYTHKQFRPATLTIIEQVNKLITEYARAGLDLTVRQIYYQFVGRGLFGDNRRFRKSGATWINDVNGTTNININYNWLKGIISDARLAGMIDWDAIVDRTRYVRQASHWRNPCEIVATCAEEYCLNSRATQVDYLEVWIEKDALIGIVEQACNPLDVAFFSCRGYVSQSAMWRAARRITDNIRTCNHDGAVILHLGDHDPSGLDMTRDIRERLEIFTGTVDIEVSRIALNLDQIEHYNPPSDPAKLSDSRYDRYVNMYGEKAYELDALDPRTLLKLIRTEIEDRTDVEDQAAELTTQQRHRAELKYVADNWSDLSKQGSDDDG